MGFGGGVVRQEWTWFLQIKGDGVQRVFVSSFFLRFVILKGEGGLSSILSKLIVDINLGDISCRLPLFALIIHSYKALSLSGP